jgi:hypothetical protein
MKNKIDSISVIVTGAAVKTYIGLGVVLSGLNYFYEQQRSEKLVGFYYKLISAELATYMILQHLLAFLI